MAIQKKNIKPKHADKSLELLSELLLALSTKKGFYIYYNDRNKKRKTIKIHLHSCGFCRWGSGMINNAKPGLNGVWVGPFSTVEQAKKFTLTHFNNNSYNNFLHTCIK